MSIYEWRQNMSIRIVASLLVVFGTVIFIAGCESNAQTGALIGAGGGALVGQAIGRDTKGTLIGAGVGAVGGYVVGSQMDKNENKARQTTTASPQTVSAAQNSDAVVTITIKNSNGSTTPVTLRKQGSDWVGPRGEHYDHLPTEAELKPVYGF